MSDYIVGVWNGMVANARQNLKNGCFFTEDEGLVYAEERIAGLKAECKKLREEIAIAKQCRATPQQMLENNPMSMHYKGGNE